MEGKTFLLGVGARKSGTTRFHRWLERSDGVRMGPINRHHVRDAALPAARCDFRRPLWSCGAQKRLQAVMQRAAFVCFAHFRRLLDTPSIRLTADITPGDPGLFADTFRRIRAGFGRLGIGVKVLFLMGDPVARSSSAERMLSGKENRLATEAGRSGTVTADAWLERNLQAEYMRLRSDYPANLSALNAAFRPKEIHAEFQETMFTPDGLGRPSRFLGVAVDPAKAVQRVNEGRPARLLPELAARAALHFGPVHDRAARTYPQTRDHWSGASCLR